MLKSTTTLDETPAASSSAIETPVQTTEPTLREGLEKLAQQVVKDSSPDKENEKSADEELIRTAEKDSPEKPEDSKTEAEEKEKPAKSTQEKPEDKDKKEDSKVDKGPVPLERFQEVVKQKNSFEEQVKTLTPMAKAYQETESYCRANNISPDEFRNVMELLVLSKTDPKKALEKATPWFEGLQAFTGDRLPQDLQTAVDSGEMTLAFAKRLAAAETASKFGERRLQQTQEQTLAQRQQAFVNDMSNQVQTWITTKKGVDPDFQPKGSPTDADGKYELFMEKLINRVSQTRLNTATDLMTLVEKVYSEASATVNRFAPPKRNGSPHVRSSRSSSQPEKEPDTLDGVVANVARKHGLVYTPTRS